MVYLLFFLSLSFFLVCFRQLLSSAIAFALSVERRWWRAGYLETDSCNAGEERRGGKKKKERARGTVYSSALYISRYLSGGARTRSLRRSSGYAKMVDCSSDCSWTGSFDDAFTAITLMKEGERERSKRFIRQSLISLSFLSG